MIEKKVSFYKAVKESIKKIPGAYRLARFVNDTFTSLTSPIKKLAGQMIASGVLKLFNTLPIKEKARVLENANAYEPLYYGKGSILTKVVNAETLRRATKLFKKEADVFRWLDKFIKEGDVFYDIGANIGAYSLVIGTSKKVKSVYAFEPGVFTFPILCENIILNNLVGIAHPFPFALSDKTAYGSFNYTSYDPGAARHFAEKDVYDVASEMKIETAFTQSLTKLDDIVLTGMLDFPNVIKIDVDGIEYEVVAGGAKVLADQRVRAVVIEMSEHEKHAERRRKIIDTMRKAGLDLFEKENKPLISNYVFVRQ